MKNLREIQYKKEDVPSSSSVPIDSDVRVSPPFSDNFKMQSSKRKHFVEVTKENQFHLLADRVTPLHHLPYEVQLKQKHRKCFHALKEFGKRFVEQGGVLPELSHNMPCVVDPIIPSPITESYRNKDEFSIRHGVDGDPKTVGFFLSSPSKNFNTICVGPDHLLIIKDSHKKLAELFQSYIRLSSLRPLIRYDDGGHWRNLVVRSNNQGDLMAVAMIHPQLLTKEVLLDEMNKFKEYVLQNKGDLNLKSLYFQACECTRCTHREAPYQLLYGDPYIFEQLNGISYRLSPGSFFQGNTSAAEQLYKVIYNACRASESTTVLDICCGIGPVSFTLAPHVKRCIGIDTCEEAIKDARHNAKLNGFENVQFHVGKIENVLPEILKEVYSQELVAVINPGRNVLSFNAIRVLRECKHLKKIVFVTCQPTAMIPNFLYLTEPCKWRQNLGLPFHPMRAVPIDLFPQTDHCELVILFQRLR